jgi:hypothetical protein
MSLDLKTTSIMTNEQSRPTWTPQPTILAERSSRGGPKNIVPPSNPKAGAQNPTLVPPSIESGIFEPPSDADNTWNSGKVEGLWTTDKGGNCWIYLREDFWIKLSENSETGVESMMLLASIARDSGATFLYRKGNDGLIHEVYVW